MHKLRPIGLTLPLVLAAALTAAFPVARAQEAPMGPLRPDQTAYLALFKELVETNTTLSSGSCTLAAERMAAHLKAAGFADADVTLFSAPDHPKEGGLVAILHGTRPKLPSPCCCWAISMWSRPSARTGPAIPSP